VRGFDSRRLHEIRLAGERCKHLPHPGTRR
jgi:hypothetical protein